MKKFAIVWSFALLVLVLFMVGCKTSAPTPEPTPAYADDPRSRLIGAEGVPRPEWMNGIDNSRAEGDYIYVVGNGRAGQLAVQRGIARSDAQAKIAQWMNAVVADTIRNYLQESGTIGNTQVLVFFEQATLTRSQANLRGFSEVTYWIDNNNIFHALYSYPRNNLRTDFASDVSDYQEFQRNDAAAYAEFRAQEAFRLLEAQMDAPRNVQPR